MKSFTPPKFVSLLAILVASFSHASSNDEADTVTTKQWFTPKEVAKNVWMISDAKDNNAYLVVGEEKALLVDTGRGAGDLKSLVESITGLPIIVVNTHAHGDHCMGNFQFDQVYLHPGDMDLWEKTMSRENLIETAKWCRKTNPELSEFFFTDYADYKETEILPVREGDVFDLGGRKLEVIETPGHTKGCICLIDKENKLLFSGDNNCRHVWLFLDQSLPVETYLKSLKKLMTYSDDFDMMLIGHNDPLDKTYLDEVLVCVNKILKGDGDFPPYSNFGEGVRECTYKRATVAFDPDKLFE